MKILNHIILLTAVLFHPISFACCCNHDFKPADNFGQQTTGSSTDDCCSDHADNHSQNDCKCFKAHQNNDIDYFSSISDFKAGFCPADNPNSKTFEYKKSAEIITPDESPPYATQFLFIINCTLIL